VPWCHLSAVHGNHNRGCSNADTTDDSLDIEGGERVSVDDLYDPANIEDHGGENQGPSSPEARGERPDKEAGEEGCGMLATARRESGQCRGRGECRRATYLPPATSSLH
jgi:hypothetical protein